MKGFIEVTRAAGLAPEGEEKMSGMPTLVALKAILEVCALSGSPSGPATITLSVKQATYPKGVVNESFEVEESHKEVLDKMHVALYE